MIAEFAMEQNCFIRVYKTLTAYKVTVYDADADATLPTIHIFSSLDSAIVYARQGYKS